MKLNGLMVRGISRTDAEQSKQFQLHWLRVYLGNLGTMKHHNVLKLLVGNAHDSNMAKLWHEVLYTLHMNIGIRHACTMPNVDGELEHGETVHLQLFAKQGIGTLVLLCIRRQIKKHQHPHNPVFT